MRVKPGSKKGPLVSTADNRELTVYVREQAVDGKANEAVIALLAMHFGVSKSCVSIVRGQTARIKIVRIAQ